MRSARKLAVSAALAALVVGVVPLFVSAAPAPAPNPDTAKYISDADTAEKSGDIVAAAQMLQSALITAPQDPANYDRLAQFYRRQGQVALARKYFSIALDIDPTNANALEGLALIELASGNRAAAEMQRDILVKACGKACPETAMVEQALASPPQPTAQ